MSDRCGDYESYEYEDQKYEIIKTKILKKDDDEVRKKGFKTSRIKTKFDEETDPRSGEESTKWRVGDKNEDLR